MATRPDLVPAVTFAPRPPRRGRVPGWGAFAGAILLAAAGVPLAFAARARVNLSADPRVQPIQDMARQPKYRPQAAADLFADGRAMRPAVGGAVARGRADADDHYFRGFSTSIDPATGAERTTYLDGYPDRVKVTPELVRRGELRFNIYCAVCHGQDGYGNGMVNARATELAEAGQAKWTPPANLHADEVRARPDGHLYNTVTAGIRNMPGYGAQVPVEDRWAIVAYVRALQLSRNAPASAVPAGAAVAAPPVPPATSPAAR